MKKNTVMTIILVLIVLLVFLALGFYFYSWGERTKIEDNTKDSSSYNNIFDDLKDLGGNVNLGAEYRILYGKNSNVITSGGTERSDCKNFTLSEYLGGGIVQRDGSNNENIKLEKYPTSYPRSKYYNNFYYISAANDPKSDFMGTVIFDWDYDDQSLYSASFNSGNNKEIVSSNNSKFPGGLLTSSDNRYLVYVMTDKTEEKFGGRRFNEENTDSDLVIYDNLTGEERKVLVGEYNRQLFDSFLDFSKTENAFFTIKREADSYKFVKVNMDTGKVLDFDHVFTGFDWTKVRWDQFFGGEFTGYPTRFHLSPDESKLLAYENISGETQDNLCAPTVTHNIWSFNINDDTIEKYDEGAGMVVDLSWKYDSQEFVFGVVSKGGCYPGYLDSSITRMQRDGQNNGVLVVEKESKIVNLSYAPDGKDVVYDVYGTDYVSYLKSVEPGNKDIKEIISTYDTEKEINQEKPVTLIFVDWVMVE